MSFFSKIFRKKDITNNEHRSFDSIETQKIYDLSLLLDSLLSSDKYIAKSEYTQILLDNKNIIDYFVVLTNSGLLSTFCKKNKIGVELVEKTIHKYNNFERFIDIHNEDYIKNEMLSDKKYLDNILKDVDPQILLDDDQRRVILTDEDYCLVIAGAGAGKTTTVAAKVKYLVEKKGVKPEQILVVSFTNKAVQELRDKLNKDLSINCPIATFHSTGNAILRKQSPEKLNIVDSSKLYFVIQEYFKSSILKNEKLANNLIMFFASYFDAPFEGNDLNDFFNKISKENYSTLRGDLDDFQRKILDARSKKSITIQSEIMRSKQEVEIANFLYLNNIDYEYEPIYEYDILMARKPYTPDFLIKQGDNIAYLEHFGISQEGKNPLYSDDQLIGYKKSVNDKISLHKKHGTQLIYTFSSYNDRRGLLEHLGEELVKCGFTLVPRSNEEVLSKLVSSEENRYIRRLVSLICRFIGNFKTNGYTAADFNRMYHSTQNVRTRLFLDICNDCYLEYERYLKENNAVDFEDMINESARVLKEVKELGSKLDFKYVIVDEYQDISRQRFDLVTSLSEVTDAKIIAVGDDWQSIYAFSGSDITLFTSFAEKMGYAKLLKIVKTYRNSQEVIDIAGNFIQKNENQIKKELKSPKTIEDPVIIYTYDGSPKKRDADNKSGALYEYAHAVEVALEQIMFYYKKEGKDPKTASILLLGRFGFDGDRLEKSGLFEYKQYGNKIKSVKYPKLNITFMTAHASKGLGYDDVIVVNGKNETYGFPSKVEDDPVLSFVIKGDRSIDYAEERRLFYVAMTRTKNRVYFIAPEQNPSEFLLEIKKDYKNVVLKGSWNETVPQNNVFKKVCPICGFPMQYRYKNSYGLRLYLCTNEPELCGFMTNEYKAGKLSIMKCDECRDGYLIVKPSKDNNYFLGCTNYKKDGTGCGKIVWKKQYYDMFGLEPDVEADVSPKTYNKTTETKTTYEEKSDEDSICIEKTKLKTGVYYEKNELNNTIHTILLCLSEISKNKYYGTTTLIDVLRGSKSKKIITAGLDLVSTYAQLQTISRDDLLTIIEWMIDNKLILKTNHPTYPVLHPTYEGQHYGEFITVGKLKKLLSLLNKEV